MAHIGDLWASGAAKISSGSAGVNDLIVSTVQSVYYGADGYNGNAGTVFVMIFDSATLPANGTVTPVHVISVPTLSNWAHGTSSFGEHFSNGIVIAVSTTGLSTGNWTLTLDAGGDQFIACDFAKEYGQY